MEALALGRKIIGIDLNTLAHFVSTVKTTPLSSNDIEILYEWLPRRMDLAGGCLPFPRIHCQRYEFARGLVSMDG